jgi:hypothetical protein
MPRLTPKRLLTWFAWLAGALLIAYAYGFVAATTADSENTGGCNAITGVVTSGHVIPPSASQPGVPAVYCDLGVHFPSLRNYYSVFIYGVLDKREQDSILVGIRNLPRIDHPHKIFVQFFEKENWRTWSDPATGRSGGSRGPESPILKLWIE